MRAGWGWGSFLSLEICTWRLWETWNSVLVSYCCYNKWSQKLWHKQHIYIILLLWRSELQNASHWSKIKVWRTTFFLETLGNNCILCLFWLLEVPCFPWLMAPSWGPFRASPVCCTTHAVISLVLFCPPLPLYVSLWLHWAHLDGPGTSPHLKVSWWVTLIPSAILTVLSM